MVDTLKHFFGHRDEADQHELTDLNQSRVFGHAVKYSFPGEKVRGSVELDDKTLIKYQNPITTGRNKIMI